MTDTSKFTAEITQLFRPRPPLKYVEHIDIAPNVRKTADITPISSIISQFKEYQTQKFAENPLTSEDKVKLEIILKKKQERQAMIEKFENDLKQWDPSNDPLIKGSPYNTMFIGRLSYEVDEIQLQQKFSQFGKIERVRVVRDKLTNKSKGYAFVVFEKESSAMDAAREMNGAEIEGRKILTDYERGRTSRQWKPRRLGGGIGGRVDLVKKKQKERQLQLIQDARGTRGGRGGSRGGRGGARGGRGGRGGSRGGRPGHDDRRNYEEGRRGYGERRSYRSEREVRGNGDFDSYRNRSDRDDRDRAMEYSSRSKRDNAERERVQSEREREKERNRDKRIQKEREDPGY